MPLMTIPERMALAQQMCGDKPRQWFFQKTVDNQIGSSAMEIFMKESRTSCEVNLYEEDSFNRGEYGNCEIQPYEFITWVMSDGSAFLFEFVENFSGIGIEDVVARYEFSFSNQRFYLW